MDLMCQCYFMYQLNTTSNRWDYSCPRSVYSILAPCVALWNIPIHNEDVHIFHTIGEINIGGGHWGVPNTAIPYEELVNTEIPCRKWTKYRYRIYDRWRLLNVVSISRVFYLSLYTPEMNLSLHEKTWENIELNGTKIEKQGHWMSYQFYHRATARNCVFIYH